MIRTRFAPSPTGFMHVGGVRTALFAWLVARQGDGKFVLRIEDTDQKREAAGAEAHIIKSLKALGLEYDEGPDIGGPFAPYRQSERLDSYKIWAEKLIGSGRAYADPYSSEEIQTFREEAQKNKQPFLYRSHRPDSPPDWDGSTPLRFKSEPKPMDWTDAVMGRLSTGPEVVDDFVLIKSDGFPTYNFAHIIDDDEMEITHIIRGQEFLASVPNYLNLYEALGLEPPIMATVPHILAPEGNKKLSKRDGAKDVLEYIDEGYLPEVLVNFIASLGWNDGTEQEIFSADELKSKFSLERVQKSGARFDEKRLLWMNGHYIRELSLEELYSKAEGFWGENNDAPEERKKQILGLVQERLKFLSELPALTSFFFEDLPADLQLIDGDKQLSKFSHAELAGMLGKGRASLEQSDFSVEDITHRLNTLLKETGQKPGVLFSLIRIATTWAPASPSLAETLSLFGKQKTLERLDKSISALEK